MNRHLIIIGIEQETYLGPAEIIKSMKKISEKFQIKKISSVYKKYLTAKHDDLNSVIFLSILAYTNENCEKVSNMIIELKNQLTKTEINLLCYDQLVLMTPLLTLPNPKLALDQGALRCSAEVYGEYQHPVLGQSLNELMREAHNFENIEFYCQGGNVFEVSTN